MEVMLRYRGRQYRFVVGWKHDSSNRRSNCSASGLVSVFGFGVFRSRSSMITMITGFSAPSRDFALSIGTAVVLRNLRQNDRHDEGRGQSS